MMQSYFFRIGLKSHDREEEALLLAEIGDGGRALEIDEMIAIRKEYWIQQARERVRR